MTRVMLRSGMHLNRFELISLVGRGGMGEVWRARDLRLGREVALKVLPEHLSREPERVTRFEREARALAALNDPRVAQIYEVSEAMSEEPADPTGGALPVRFLVMELVEGETLARRLEQGPLPLSSSLDLARQVGEALLAAHRHGVIHRDLKPANIMVTPDGGAKVLDFGLARFRPRSRASDQIDITQTLSDSGVVVGTAAYMSPEQVRGQDCDERCDVWAFGCCLLEMLSGARAFPGATVPEIVGRVLAGLADLEKLPVGTPKAMRRLVEGCLSTDRENRPWMAEVMRSLEQLGSSPTRRWGNRAWPWIARAMAAAAAAMLFWLFSTGRHRLIPRVPGESRLAVALEPLRAQNPSPTLVTLLQPANDELLKAIAGRTTLVVVSTGAAEVHVQGMAAGTEDGPQLRLRLTEGITGTVLAVLDAPIDPERREQTIAQAAGAVASALELEQVCRELGRSDPLHGFLARHTKSLEAARAFRDGLQLSARTRQAEARQAFQRAAAADLTFWPVHLYLALNAKATGHFKEWKEELATARKLLPSPDEREAVVVEEVATTLAEDSERRLEALERARKFFPESGELTFRAAQAYRFQDRPAEAISLLEELLQSGWRPDWSPTREELAFSQLLAGKLADVLRTTGEGEERFPTRYKYPLYSAFALQQLSRPLEARAALARAIRKQLDFTTAPPLAVHQMAGYWASLLRWNEERQRQWEAVLMEAGRGLRDKPADRSLLQARGEALMWLGQLTAARTVLEPLAAAVDADPGVLLALSRARVGLGDLEGARKALADAAAGWRQGNVPALGTLAYNIAAGWAAVGDARQALEWLLRARDQYGVDRLDLALDPDLDPLRHAGLLAQLPPHR